MIALVGPYRKERARLRGALHIIHIALEEEGVTRGLLKQILPLERRRGSKLMWQSCGHQAVDWEGCTTEGKALCTQQDHFFVGGGTLPNNTIPQPFSEKEKWGATARRLIGTNWTQIWNQND